MTRHLGRFRHALAESPLRRDDGVALVVALMVTVLVTGLAAAVAFVSINNMKSADRDRQGQSALDIADAGVAAGVEYLRTHPFSTITCPESSYTPGVTPTDPNCVGAGVSTWSNPTNPTVVTVAGKTYQVWIGLVAKAAPPAQKVWTFRVHSTGLSGTSLAATRVINADVSATPLPLPIGVYADYVDATGNGSVANESIISPNCIDVNGSFGGSGSDLFYGGSAAIKSSVGIVRTGSCTPAKDLVSGSSCSYKGVALADPYGTGSCFFDANTLASYGYQPGGLSAAQYAALKTIAQSEGQYYSGTTAYTPPDPTVYPNAVMFFDSPTSVVKLGSDLNAYGSSYCGGRSLVIVVRNGDVAMNAGTDIVGAIIAPQGNFKYNGNATFTGTVFVASFSKFNGTATLQMQSCWLANPPGGLFDFALSNYRQLDR